MRVSLTHGGRVLMLSDGTYVVGRSLRADIVIDEPRVSRQHARLELEGDRLRVSDLGSRNGVLVNGLRIRSPRVLYDGDIVSIGGETVDVRIGALELSERPGKGNPDEQTLTASRARPTTTDAGSDQRITQVFGELDTIAQVAQRALMAGHAREAESMVKAHLEKVLDDCRSKTRVSQGTIDNAIHLGLALARATHRRTWFDYVVDLMCETNLACSPAQVHELESAALLVPTVDLQRLKRYSTLLRSESPTMESIRAARLVDELVAALDAGGRRR